MPSIRDDILSAIQELQDNKTAADNQAATHQADAPNPVPGIVGAFKSYLPQAPDLTPVHEPNTQPKDYLRELAQNPEILNKGIDQASNFNFGGVLKLKHMEGPHPSLRETTPTSDFYHMLDENQQHAGEVQAEWNPETKHVDLSIWSNQGPNQYGTAQMRDLLLKQIKEQYPDARSVGGLRDTGSNPGRDMKLKLR